MGSVDDGTVFAALERERKRLEFLLAATSAMTYSCNPTPPFAATFVSESVKAFLGWDAKRFLDDPNFWADHLHPEERDAILAGVGRAFVEGRHIHEYRFLHADGTYRWIRDDLAVIADETGAPRELVGCMIDVTSRVEAEHAMRRSERNFRVLIETLPIGIFVHRDLKIVYANPAFVALLGATSYRTVVGISPLDFAHERDRPMVEKRIARITDPDGPIHSPRIETSMRRFDGKSFPCEVESIRIEFDGKTSVLVIVRDLTEHHEMLGRLAAADRLASIGTLAAGVAHEINNPLTFVVTNLAALSEELASPAPRDGHAIRWGDVVHLLRDANDGAARVRVVVRDLLRLARPGEDESRPVDVRNVLESCIKITQSETRYRAQVVRQFQPVPMIRANESRLGQVFMNLLVNAGQSIPPGHPLENEIRVVTRAADEGVVIEVQDTGPGVPPELRARIFEPFFTTKPAGLGTGLGLSVARRIVEGMGGRIACRDRVGGGATFEITLPADGATESASEPQRKGEAAVVSRPRVLVVDDEEAMGTTLRFLLQPDFEVTAVTSVRDALARIESGHHFDAVLTDLVLPGLDGMYFFDKLGEVAPALRERTAFMTGGAYTAPARKFLEERAKATIEKPFEPAELRELLRGLIAKRGE